MKINELTIQNDIIEIDFTIEKENDKILIKSEIKDLLLSNFNHNDDLNQINNLSLKRYYSTFNNKSKKMTFMAIGY